MQTSVKVIFSGSEGHGMSAF